MHGAYNVKLIHKTFRVSTEEKIQNLASHFIQLIVRITQRPQIRKKLDNIERFKWRILIVILVLVVTIKISS